MKFEFDLPETLSHNGVDFFPAAASPDELSRFLSYVIDYGFGKAMQDAVAGRKKELTAEGMNETDIADTLRAEMHDRLSDILSGNVGKRAARLSGPDAIRREVVDYFFNQWKVGATKKGLVLPTLKNVFNVGVKEATADQRKHIADEIVKIKAKVAAHPNWASKIEAEVERRLALRSGPVIEDDFDIFGDLTGPAAQSDEAPKAKGRKAKSEAE